MISRRVASTILVLALAVTGGAAVAGPAQADRAGILTCVTAMDSPHYSSGAGGAIAKFRYCDLDGNNVDVMLYLFLCPQKPGSNEADWVPVYGCVQKLASSYQWYAQIQVQYTRYVPVTGIPGAHGTGWWVACANLIAPYSYYYPSVPQNFSA